MSKKLPLLYYRPGKLNPTQGISDWFEEEPYGITDFQKEISMYNLNELLDSICEMFLFDELNLNIFLDSLGCFSKIDNGVYKSKKLIHPNMLEMQVVASFNLTLEYIETIFLKLQGITSFSQELTAKYHYSEHDGVGFILNEISPTCRGIISKSENTQSDQTTLLLSYQRKTSPS
jgi:hypothetical protein